MNRIPAKLANLLLAACSVLFFLGAIEVTARIYDWLSPLPPGLMEFIRSQPPPFAGAPYFSEEFIQEASSQETYRQSDVPDLTAQQDFAGKYFNVRSGFRVTTDQPSSPKNSIYVFGGSTIFSAEVPDALTIPSLLQKRMREQFNDRFIVHNYGVSGMTVGQQNSRLRTLDLKPGDYVIYYDGTNEVGDFVYEGNADPVVARGVAEAESSWQRERWAYSIWNLFSPYSTFIRRFGDVTRNFKWSVPAHLQDQERLRAILQRVEASYGRELREAHEVATARGARFLHFLQPTIFTASRRSAYEESLIQNHFLIYDGLQLAHERTYPVLRRAIQGLQGDVTSYDLTGVLDGRAPGAEYFIDECHITDKGNAVIAEAIADKLVGAINAGPGGVRRSPAD